MQGKNQLVDELSQKLLDAQRKLLELRQVAERAGEGEALANIDNLIALGLQMGLFVTALANPDFNDETGVAEVREYSDLVTQIYEQNKD